MSLAARLKALLPGPVHRGLRRAAWAVCGGLRRRQNRRLDGRPHIHVLRETEHEGYYAFFEWLRQTRPEAAGLFRHTVVTDRDAGPFEGASLFLPWLQDPVFERDRTLFDRVSAIETRYASRGVPTVNPVRVLSNAIKSRALATMREAGVRTARFASIDPGAPFEDIAAEVGTPFIVRNDQGHGGYLRVVETPDDLAAIDWTQLAQPLAVEFIDTRGADGYFRKYRYLFAGDVGVARHLIISPSWNAHARDRVRGEAHVAEELAFVNTPNPHHETLNNLREALDLDYVAFDYSLLPDGELVVWEPNPYPVLWDSISAADGYLDYQRSHMDAVFSVVLLYYLQRARLPLPGRLGDESS